MKNLKKTLAVLTAALLLCLCTLAVSAEAAPAVSVRIEGIEETLFDGDVPLGDAVTVVDVLKALDEQEDSLTLEIVDSAYGPWLYERLHNKEGDYRKTIRSNVNLLISVIGLFFVGISLFAQDYIVLFVDKSYVDAWRYVPLLVATFAIKTAYYFFVEVLCWQSNVSAF